MKRLLSIAAAFTLFGAPALAEIIRIGVIGQLSGSSARQGESIRAGIDAWLAVNGAKVGNDEIEVVYRDVTSAERLESLITQEKLQYLANFGSSADVLAVAPRLQQANVPMVVMSSVAAKVVTASPLVVRTTATAAQSSFPLGVLAGNAGIESAVALVSDDETGADAEAAFVAGLEREGGRLVDTIHIPSKIEDFSPLLQRAGQAGAQAFFVYLPSGSTAHALLRNYTDSDLQTSGVRLLEAADVPAEDVFGKVGEPILGSLTTYGYAQSGPSQENTVFLNALRQVVRDRESPLAAVAGPALGAYDGMYVLSKMIEATEGKQNAFKAVEAVKGLTWISPRGPVSIDPDSRNLVQTIYLREVAKDGDRYVDRELKSFEGQENSGLAYFGR